MSQHTREYDDRSTMGLINDLVTQVSNLFRKEFALFRAETGEKMNQVFNAVGMIVGGVVMALVALIVLATALVAAIAELGIAPGWAALIVGGGIAIIAIVLAMKGINDLKASQLAPQRTVHSLEKDAEFVKGARK